MPMAEYQMSLANTSGQLAYRLDDLQLIKNGFQSIQTIDGSDTLKVWHKEKSAYSERIWLSQDDDIWLTEKCMPASDDGSIMCNSCEHQEECCPHANSCGRTVNISYYLLPHIDETDPPMSKRFKATMTKRPSVERMIKRLKCDLGDDRLTKRGNSAFQAYLDKTLIAYHILLRR
jgi:hypothetical protein